MTSEPSPGLEPVSASKGHRTVLALERRPPTGEREWALAFLPGFPLLLLVLRVWYLARQDLQTVLLVLASANALGLIAALLISFVWAAPALVLVLRMLHLMLLASGVASRSWLARAEARTPGWVTVPAAAVAALSWQLRFLPVLLMLILVITGLELRLRPTGPARFLPIGPTWAVASALTVVPALAWVAPAAVSTVSAVSARRDLVTAALLVVPLLVAPVLPGPLPPRVARWLLPGLATVVVLTLPVLLGQRYLTAPVLPHVAVRFQPPGQAEQVRRGNLVGVDDRFVTVLDTHGRVHFIPNEQVKSQALCSTGPEPPSSPVSVHGWQVEQSVLSWAGPRPAEQVPQADCRGD